MLTLLAANGILQGLETKTQEWVGKVIGVGLMVGFYLGLKSDSAESFSAEKGGKWLGSHCRDCGEAKPFDEIEIMAGNARCKPGYGCKQFTKEEMEETERQMRKKYPDAGWDDFSAESFSDIADIEITTFQPFMKELPPPQTYLETIVPTGWELNRGWSLSVMANGDEYYGWKTGEVGNSQGQWWFYPSFDGNRLGERKEAGTLSGEDEWIFYDEDDADQPAVWFSEVEEAANKWLKQIGYPFGTTNNDEPGVWVWTDGNISDEVLDEWEDYWENKKCNHEDWDFKIIEERDNELLLTLKCLNCDKRAGVSTPLSHKDWMAEAFSAESFEAATRKCGACGSTAHNARSCPKKADVEADVRRVLEKELKKIFPNSKATIVKLKAVAKSGEGTWGKQDKEGKKQHYAVDLKIEGESKVKGLHSYDIKWETGTHTIPMNIDRILTGKEGRDKSKAIDNAEREKRNLEIRGKQATKLLNAVMTDVYKHFRMRSGYANRDGIDSITYGDAYLGGGGRWSKNFSTGTGGEAGNVEIKSEMEYDDTVDYFPSRKTQQQINELQTTLRRKYANASIDIGMEGGGDKAYKYGLTVYASIKDAAGL